MKNLLVGVGCWVVGGFMMWSFVNGGADPDCGYDCEEPVKVTVEQKQQFLNESYIETQRAIAHEQYMQRLIKEQQEQRYLLDSRLYK